MKKRQRPEPMVGPSTTIFKIVVSILLNENRTKGENERHHVRWWLTTASLGRRVSLERKIVLIKHEKKKRRKIVKNDGGKKKKIHI